MAKDPAFLWYPGDWRGGTGRYTRHEKGCYMDLLMEQFDKFDEGNLTLEEIKHILGIDFPLWDLKLRFKFKKDSAGNFFNQKLNNEILKRRKWTKSRNDNLNKNKPSPSHMDNHMENGNGNEGISEIVLKKEDSEKKNFLDLKEKFLNDASFTSDVEFKYMVSLDDLKIIANDFFVTKTGTGEYKTILKEADCRRNLFYFIPKSDHYKKIKNINANNSGNSSRATVIATGKRSPGKF